MGNPAGTAATELRVGLAQINSTVGDLSGNSALIVDAVRSAGLVGAGLVVFPEMALTGYPVEDLALRPSFQEASKKAIHALAEQLHSEGLGEIACIVGYLDALDSAEQSRIGRPRGGPINAAAIIHRGAVIGRYAKHHLPNYGVFDEARYFVPGTEPCTVMINGARVSIAICEDLWRDEGPVLWARENDSALLVVLNASPYEVSKDDNRLALCTRQAQAAGCALLYVNMVGGQDELVFDGDSMVIADSGQLILRGRQFVADTYYADLSLPVASEQDESIPTLTVPVPPEMSLVPEEQPSRLEDLAEIYEALVLGLRDYVRKNGFTSVILGLSGGIDSALVAALARDAIGGSSVYGVGMPSRFSSEHSRADAQDLATRCGLNFREVPIEPMFAAFMGALELSGLAEENLQARIRGMILMSLSNQHGHLVLATGNKSEISVGYSTIYGDAVGGFAPIKDVPKTLVWELANWRNAIAHSRGETMPIPPSSITKPPSAELRPDQLDSDSLPDYTELDAILESYVSGDAGLAELIAQGHSPSVATKVVRLTDAAEYKRRQYPPGTKITLRAFGRDRRLPITNRWRED